MKKFILFLLMILTTYSVMSLEISIYPGIQYIYGQTHEIVYDTYDGKDYTLSQLDWDQKVLLAGGEIDLSYNRYFINGSVYTNLGYGSGGMVDHDWMGYNPYFGINMEGHDPSEWTHQSKSTVKMRIQKYDINGSVNTNKFFNLLTLNFALGFRNEERYWTDALQSLTYSDQGFRDLKMTFSGNPAINYNVSISYPYFKGSAQIELNKLSISIHGEYSGAVKITDVDNHLMRGLTFIDTMKNYTYVGGGLKTIWQFNKSIYIRAEGNYSVILEGDPGDLVIWDNNGISNFQSGVAGFAQESFTGSISFGMKL